MGGPPKWYRRHWLLRHTAWICCASGVAAGAWPGTLAMHTATFALVTSGAAGYPLGIGSELTRLAAAALEVAALILSAAVFGDTGGTGNSRRRALLLDAGIIYVATVWLAYAAAAAMYAAILGR